MATSEADPNAKGSSQRGTLTFAAPERLHGRRGGPLSDQYSFCVSLFEALHGTLPYRGATMFELIDAIDEGRREPGRADVPAAVQAVLDKGLSIDPRDRFADMPTLLRTLQAALDSLPATSPKQAPQPMGLLDKLILEPTPDPPAVRRRHRGGQALLLAAAGVLMIAGCGYSIGAYVTQSEASMLAVTKIVKDNQNICHVVVRAITAAERGQGTAAHDLLNEAASQAGDNDALILLVGHGADKVGDGLHVAGQLMDAYDAYRLARQLHQKTGDEARAAESLLRARKVQADRQKRGLNLELDGLR